MIFSKDNSENNAAELDQVDDSALIDENQTVADGIFSTPAEPQTPLRPSILSEGFEFVGELKAPHGHVTIDGTFRGVLHVKSVVVGQSGHVDGEVQADLITLKGQLKGSVDAEEIQMASRAVLDGTTTYHDLTIARGAQVLGELKRR